MKRYSICINDTFCLVLDQKTLFIHKYHGNLGILMTKISQIYAKMYRLKYHVTKMNNTIYIT